MKWMIKGILRETSSLVYIPIFTAFIHSSYQFGAFLSPLDMRADFGLYHLIYDLCHARKSVDD